MICIHIWFFGNYHLEQRMRLHYPGGSSHYRRTPNTVPISVQRVKSDPAADIDKVGYLDLLLSLHLAALCPDISAETTDSQEQSLETIRTHRKEVPLRQETTWRKKMDNWRENNYLNLTNADLRYRQTSASPEWQHTKVNCISSLCPIT